MKPNAYVPKTPTCTPWEEARLLCCLLPPAMGLPSSRSFYLTYHTARLHPLPGPFLCLPSRHPPHISQILSTRLLMGDVNLPSLWEDGVRELGSE